MKIVIKDYKAPTTNKMYSGRHWTKRKDETDLIHQLVQTEVLNSGIEPIEDFPVDIKITAHYEYKYKRDSGNVSNKEFIDGLIEAGILPDDTIEYVRWVATRAIIGVDEDKVIINIEEVKDE